MRKFLAKQLGFLLQDTFTKTNIRSISKELMHSQYWSDDIINAYQLKKLKILVRNAFEKSPYYKESLSRSGIGPNDIHDLSDIEKLPILNKEDVKNNNYDLVTNLKDFKSVKRGKTGGTTGSPIITYKDNFDRTFTWASYYRWYSWMGLHREDPVLTFWGTPTVLTTNRKKDLKKQLTEFMLNRFTIDSFNLRSDTMPFVIDQLNRRKPYLIKGYLSSLLQVADYLVYNKIQLHFELKAISTTTESIMPHHRQHLFNAFNAPIYDQYGCGEVGSIAFECAKHNGLHINCEHVIVEVLDENNIPIKDGTGKLVVTNLDNLVMPFIRYVNGDIVTITSSKCSCGVNQPLLTRIDGRAVDTLTLKNGNQVHGVFITDILFEIGVLADTISRFQVYQNKIGEIEMRFEERNEISAQTCNLIKNNLLRYFSTVELVYYKELPSEANGKFKYIINQIPR